MITKDLLFWRVEYVEILRLLDEAVWVDGSQRWVSFRDIARQLPMSIKRIQQEHLKNLADVGFVELDRRPLDDNSPWYSLSFRNYPCAKITSLGKDVLKHVRAVQDVTEKAMSVPKVSAVSLTDELKGMKGSL
jgi:DNA-binding transcriptional ArsR family regulator